MCCYPHDFAPKFKPVIMLQPFVPILNKCLCIELLNETYRIFNARYKQMGGTFEHCFPAHLEKCKYYTYVYIKYVARIQEYGFSCVINIWMCVFLLYLVHHYLSKGDIHFLKFYKLKLKCFAACMQKKL